MGRTVKHTLAVTAAAVSLLVALFGYTATADASGGASVVRFGGSDRFGTAGLVAPKVWSSGSSTVYLAYGFNFPDALAGVSLATVSKAPILLTDTNKAPDSTMSELKALGAKNVVLLGGPGVISAAVVNQLKVAKYSVSQVYGQDRYGTAVAVGTQVLAKSHSTTAVVVYGFNFPDALSISPVAGMEGGPVVFSNGTNLPDVTAKFIKDNGIKTVYIAGGPGVVGSKVGAQLKTLGVTSVTWLYGDDRYATSAAVAAKFKSLFSANVSVATGAEFADALTGGVLSAKLKVPMLLLNPATGATPAEQAYTKPLVSPTVYVYGGTGALSDPIVNTITLNPPAPTLAVTPTSWTVQAAGGSQTFNVASNQATWTASSANTWASLVSTPTGFTVTVSANTVTTSRTTSITVTSPAGVSQTIKVVQNPDGLTVHNAAIALPAIGGTATTTVTTTAASWSIPTNLTAYPWLTVTPKSGTSGGTITFTATKANVATARTATIQVTDGTRTVNVVMDQAAAPAPTLTILSRGFNGNGTQVVMQYKVTDNYNLGWTVTVTCAKATDHVSNTGTITVLDAFGIGTFGCTDPSQLTATITSP